MSKFLDSLSRGLAITDKTYRREQYQSFMTGPEWRNVEMAEEYARFIKEGRSIFHFPYFRQIGSLWKVIGNSYSLARKYDSAWQIISSEYMLMDLFIGVFTTLELLPKAILSLFLSPFLNKKNDTPMQSHLADFYTQYAKDLQTIPFYDQDYDGIRRNLAIKYAAEKSKTWGDWFSWHCTSIELRARKWISKPLHYWFHQDNNLVPATTDALIKLKVENFDDPQQAENALRNKVNGAVKDVYVKPKSPAKSYTAVYARLQVPRYAAFQQTLNELTAQGIQLKKIADQDHVQVKCTIDAESQDDLDSTQNKLMSQAPGSFVYRYSDGIHPYRRICLFDLPIKELAAKTAALNEVEHATVTFIHNF